MIPEKPVTSPVRTDKPTKGEIFAVNLLFFGSMLLGAVMAGCAIVTYINQIG